MPLDCPYTQEARDLKKHTQTRQRAALAFVVEKAARRTPAYRRCYHAICGNTEGGHNQEWGHYLHCFDCFSHCLDHLERADDKQDIPLN